MKKRTLQKELQDFTHNIICGKHSGFKPCCIAWFSLIWWPLRIRDRENKILRKITNYYFNLPGMREYDYVPCLKCFIKKEKPVKLKKCKCKFNKNRDTILGQIIFEIINDQ